MRVGQIEFLKMNAARWDWRDTYHWLLTLSWPGFAGSATTLVGSVVFALYTVINLLFATLYYLGAPCIADLPANSFLDAFFFSVETLATVGYGHWYPDTRYGHLVTTDEIMSGMFGLAVITGLIFVRFSRPTARVVFSRALVVAPFDGQPALMMRVANLRHHAMVEAEFRLMLIRNETVAEGETLRRFYALPLQIERLIVFPAAITIRHLIDEKSPLHGATAATLEASDARLVASVVCVDTVIPAPVQSQQDYTWRDVRFGERFAEIYTELENGRLTVDYGRLHETEAVTLKTAVATAADTSS